MAWRERKEGVERALRQKITEVERNQGCGRAYRRDGRKGECCSDAERMKRTKRKGTGRRKGP